MGINGLLPVLKPITRSVHVSKYNGKSVAVDGYSWLHKGVYSCSRELCLGQYTNKHVQYCVGRVEMLRHHGVEPVLVFDGGKLPMKSNEEEVRHRSRKESLAKALALMNAGNLTAAEQAFQRAVDVTPAMTKQVIEEMKCRNVRCLVAPYEADAQMAYLAIRGDVHAVITEDSDLLAYGCPRVLFKLDRAGNGEEVSLEDLPLNTGHGGGVPLAGFTHTMFQEMCVMAGCDFLPNLPKIGIKTAHAHIKKLKNFTKVCKHLRFENKTTLPHDYEQNFQRSLWVFRHQRVYCPHSKQCVHLRPLPDGGLGAADVDVPAALPPRKPPSNPDEIGEEDTDFLGPHLEPDVVQGIAEGQLDPFTKQPFNLAAIYAGCRHMPPAVSQQLKGQASANGHDNVSSGWNVKTAAVRPYTTLGELFNSGGNVQQHAEGVQHNSGRSSSAPPSRASGNTMSNSQHIYKLSKVHHKQSNVTRVSGKENNVQSPAVPERGNIKSLFAMAMKRNSNSASGSMSSQSQEIDCTADDAENQQPGSRDCKSVGSSPAEQGMSSPTKTFTRPRKMMRVGMQRLTQTKLSNSDGVFAAKAKQHVRLDEESMAPIHSKQQQVMVATKEPVEKLRDVTNLLAFKRNSNAVKTGDQTSPAMNMESKAVTPLQQQDTAAIDQKLQPTSAAGVPAVPSQPMLALKALSRPNTHAYSEVSSIPSLPSMCPGPTSQQDVDQHHAQTNNNKQAGSVAVEQAKAAALGHEEQQGSQACSSPAGNTAGEPIHGTTSAHKASESGKPMPVVNAAEANTPVHQPVTNMLHHTSPSSTGQEALLTDSHHQLHTHAISVSETPLSHVEYVPNSPDEPFLLQNRNLFHQHAFQPYNDQLPVLDGLTTSSESSLLFEADRHRRAGRLLGRHAGIADMVTSTSDEDVDAPLQRHWASQNPDAMGVARKLVTPAVYVFGEQASRPVVMGPSMQLSLSEDNSNGLLGHAVEEENQQFVISEEPTNRLQSKQQQAAQVRQAILRGYDDPNMITALKQDELEDGQEHAMQAAENGQESGKQQPDSGSGSVGNFHSVRHVKHYVVLAANAINQIAAEQTVADHPPPQQGLETLQPVPGHASPVPDLLQFACTAGQHRTAGRAQHLASNHAKILAGDDIQRCWQHQTSQHGMPGMHGAVTLSKKLLSGVQRRSGHVSGLRRPIPGPRRAQGLDDDVLRSDSLVSNGLQGTRNQGFGHIHDQAVSAIQCKQAQQQVNSLSPGYLDRFAFSRTANKRVRL